MVRDAPGVRLAAVADPEPESRRSASRVPGYDTLEQALAVVECDVVLVAVLGCARSIERGATVDVAKLLVARGAEK